MDSPEAASRSHDKRRFGASGALLDGCLMEHTRPSGVQACSRPHQTNIKLLCARVIAAVRFCVSLQQLREQRLGYVLASASRSCSWQRGCRASTGPDTRRAIGILSRMAALML